MISVVIPVFNTKDIFLRQCIDSVICHQNIDVILINDGSTDVDTVKTCEYYANKYKNVQLVSQENSGPSVARNKGFNSAVGEYVIFLDGDDWWNENVLATLEQVLEQHKPDILVFQAEKVEYATGEKTFIGKQQSEIRSWETGREALKEILSENITYEWYAWKYIIKKSLLQLNGLFFENGLFYEDVDFVPRMICSANRVVCVPDILVNYRFHNPTSILNTPNIKKSNDKLLVVNRLVSFVKSIEDEQLSCLLLKNISQLLLSAYGDYINGANVDFDLLKQNFNLLKYSDERFGKIGYTVCQLLGIKTGSSVIRKILGKQGMDRR